MQLLQESNILGCWRSLGDDRFSYLGLRRHIKSTQASVGVAYQLAHTEFSSSKLAYIGTLESGNYHLHEGQSRVRWPQASRDAESAEEIGQPMNTV